MPYFFSHLDFLSPYEDKNRLTLWIYDDTFNDYAKLKFLVTLEKVISETPYYTLLLSLLIYHEVIKGFLN